MSTAATPSLAGTSINPLARLVRRWNEFWFTPADPTSLGLIRLLCGAVVVYVHLAYSFDLQDFFGANAWLDLRTADETRQEAPWVAPPTGWDVAPAPPFTPGADDEMRKTIRYMQRWGVDPRLADYHGNYYWSVWFHVSDPRLMQAVHAGILAVMVLFTLGLWTRITSVLTWAAALSYIHRSPMTLFGMDTIMIVLLLYLAIGPSGAALSLDRLWLRLRAARRGEPLPPPDPSVSANLALRLMQVHFCIIYLAAGLSKLLGGAWWNGTALWWTLANYEFTPLRYPAYAESLRWLCRHRWLWEVVMTGGVLYTLALEISFPYLVWQPRWRPLMVWGAVLLHTFIAVTMGLVGFGLFMLALVLSFVPGTAVRRLLTCQWRGA